MAADPPHHVTSGGRTDNGAAAGVFRVPFVALTGGLGSGKSTACAALERLGAATISTDAVVHELYASATVRDAVVARWGPEVAPGGVVDRGAIARHVFAEPAEREWLEGLLWPLVGERVREFRAEQEGAHPAPKAAVVETPLLFEAGMDGLYDATIAVVADEDVRRERAAARGHEAVDERAARQLSQDEKAQRATFVVRNDGSVADLERRLSDVLATLGSR
ncbi:dephospho-CoA kinase [Baekduia soli]|uniref:Dephospho-CoA kinase n=1 Tax=Baekduia soli TaxID=496014 RepID=A0A5B8U8Y6_9ACTN|nr:dephospho-CoA kinase [Baekduia soli]QEC49603.1 dephospho-CoA kinase [Baekduia soli]